MKTANTLTLHVLNNEYLASGKHASTLFNANGGTIGCAENNHWIIQNQQQQVESLHAGIEVIDGQFCINAYAPNLYLNSIDLFNKNRPVRLQHGDSLQLGDLKIKVLINERGISRPDPLATRPEEIISNHSDPIDEVLNKEKASFIHESQQDMDKSAPLITPTSIDPMKVLDAEILSTKSELDNQHKKTPFSSSNHNVMEQFMGNEQLAQGSNLLDEKVVNVAINPLFQGLASAIDLKNSQEAYDFLEEIGHSIRVTIEGLRSLHITHSNLANKHLRPTEDNPLRLNLGYQDTLNFLYSMDKCPVHLAAPSAISESLHHVQLHYEANQLAISEALAALLQAFSPQALMSRFLRYRRSSERNETNSSWAWEMYSNYFSELTSNRQKGFDKLFWEIYEQAYDHHIRRLLQRDENTL